MTYYTKSTIRHNQFIFLMKDNNHLNTFHSEMNAMHSNLEFTLEKSANGKLPFLDTEVKLVSNTLHTKVYRKPTDTSLLMQYTSVCPKAWKLGLLDCYLNRAYNLR